MNYLGSLLALGVQGAPAPEGPQPQVVAPASEAAQSQVVVRATAPEGGDEGIRLARYFAGEQDYAGRLGRALGRDLSGYWADYQEDQKDRAEDQAEGDDDEDSAVQSFAQYMDDRYRRRLKLGGILLGVGFAPLGFGLYIGSRARRRVPVLTGRYLERTRSVRSAASPGRCERPAPSTRRCCR